MRYRQTPIYQNITTIYNEELEAAVLDLGDELARLLYCDCNTTLLKLSEMEAIKAEKRVLSASFPSFNEKLKSFLEENGFRTEENGKILAVNVEDLLISSKAKKLLEEPVESYIWIPFRDLMAYQIMELEEVFEKLHIVIHREELLRFDSDLSGIVYDQDRKIRDFDLVSVSGSDIIFEGLFYIDTNDKEVEKAVAWGLVSQIIDCNLAKKYDRIAFVDPEPEERELVKAFLDNQDCFTEIGTIVSARKNLTKKVQDFELPKVQMRYDAETMIIELVADKLATVPFQDTINWKTDGC